VALPEVSLVVSHCEKCNSADIYLENKIIRELTRSWYLLCVHSMKVDSGHYPSQELIQKVISCLLLYRLVYRVLKNIVGGND